MSVLIEILALKS